MYLIKVTDHRKIASVQKSSGELESLRVSLYYKSLFHRHTKDD